MEVDYNWLLSPEGISKNRFLTPQEYLDRYSCLDIPHIEMFNEALDNERAEVQRQEEISKHDKDMLKYTLDDHQAAIKDILNYLQYDECVSLRVKRDIERILYENSV